MNVYARKPTTEGLKKENIRLTRLVESYKLLTLSLFIIIVLAIIVTYAICYIAFV